MLDSMLRVHSWRLSCCCSTRSSGGSSERRTHRVGHCRTPPQRSLLNWHGRSRWTAPAILPIHHTLARPLQFGLSHIFPRGGISQAYPAWMQTTRHLHTCYDPPGHPNCLPPRGVPLGPMAEGGVSCNQHFDSTLRSGHHKAHTSGLLQKCFDLIFGLSSHARGVNGGQSVDGNYGW